MNADTLSRALVGRVVSNKMNKTITVLVERYVKHHLYGKLVVRSKKYHAHDETGICQQGDLVEIIPFRPISRTKAWMLSRVVEKGRL